MIFNISPINTDRQVVVQYSIYSIQYTVYTLLIVYLPRVYLGVHCEIYVAQIGFTVYHIIYIKLHHC